MFFVTEAILPDSKRKLTVIYVSFARQILSQKIGIIPRKPQVFKKLLESFITQKDYVCIKIFNPFMHNVIKWPDIDF